ncbi:hypothetical protein [Bordetella petrii]|uniref:hypothetical protein n=1 Tax=Bordetella petrii TaxID=94624 RepID=UPI001A9688FB|nr:hypothetical protein [Bordetella petrii]MBO1110633.1 hypothetical protein [Bordetella petrii]
MGKPFIGQHCRASRFARWAAGMAACLSAVAVAAAHAGAGPGPASLALPPGSTQAPLGSQMRLYGMPADIRLIEIPLPVAQAAPALARHHPVLSDLGVYSGFVILSGQSAGELWLAVLEAAGPQRTRGSVSVLGAAAPDGARLPARPAWLPPGARLRLDFSDADGGGRTIHQVWTVALPVAQARQAVADRLRRAGWHPGAGADAAHRWLRGPAWLDIAIVAVEGGSGVLLLQHEKATP